MKGIFYLPIMLLWGCAALQAQQQTDCSPALRGEQSVTAYTPSPEATTSATFPESSTPGIDPRTTALSATNPAPADTSTAAQAQTPAAQTPSQTYSPATQPPTAPATQPQNTPVALPRTIPPEVQPVPDKEAEKLPCTERRRLKAQRFAARLDSLVQSHNFRFLPNSMQELPGGWTQLIYNELYFVGVFSDHVEVHMPMIRGNMVEYIEILNFDTFEVKNYQVSKVQYGWNVSFNIIHSEQPYTVNMMVYTLTGETVLNLLTLSNTIRYVGYIQPLSKD